MAEETKRNGWGRIAITALITFLLSSGFWNFLNQYSNSDKVTRAEVKSMVQEGGPYNQDRAMVLKNLQDLQKGQEELKKEIQDLRGEIRAERRLR